MLALFVLANIGILLAVAGGLLPLVANGGLSFVAAFASVNLLIAWIMFDTRRKSEASGDCGLEIVDFLDFDGLD